MRHVRLTDERQVTEELKPTYPEGRPNITVNVSSPGPVDENLLRIIEEAISRCRMGLRRR